MRKELLRISHVSLERDGEQLLDNLEFQMFAGEIFGLVAAEPERPEGDGGSDLPERSDYAGVCLV